MIGAVYKSPTYGSYRVLDLVGRDKWNHRLYLVRFDITGGESIALSYHITKGLVKDPKAVTVYGVGYLDCDPTFRKDNKFLYSRWRGVLERCYYDKSPRFKWYGFRGVRVCDRWHSFYNFVNDVKILPGYKEPVEGLQLDKDKLGDGLLYSHESCCCLDT